MFTAAPSTLVPSASVGKMASSSIFAFVVICAAVAVAAGKTYPMSPLEMVEENQFNSLGGDADIPDLNGEGCGVDRHCVFVKNGCNEFIWVLAHYEPLGHAWVMDGWWRIPPNSRKFIINNAKNAAIFFHAQNADCSMIWGDQKRSWGFQGGLYAFSKEIMPDNVLFYTMVFDCAGNVATKAFVSGPSLTTPVA